jgi:hypothetical protein
MPVLTGGFENRFYTYPLELCRKNHRLLLPLEEKKSVFLVFFSEGKGKLREKKKAKKRNGQLCNIAMDVTTDNKRVWRSHG